jgi:hypothetical protein
MRWRSLSTLSAFFHRAQIRAQFMGEVGGCSLPTDQGGKDVLA